MKITVLIRQPREGFVRFIKIWQFWFYLNCETSVPVPSRNRSLGQNSESLLVPDPRVFWSELPRSKFWRFAVVHISNTEKNSKNFWNPSGSVHQTPIMDPITVDVAQKACLPVTWHMLMHTINWDSLSNSGFLSAGTDLKVYKRLIGDRDLAKEADFDNSKLSYM